MPTATLSARGLHRAYLGVNLCSGAGRPGAAKTIEDTQHVQAFALTQPVGSSGVVGHRLADNVALRLAQTGGCPPNLLHRGLVE